MQRFNNRQIRVGVLRGGEGATHDASIRDGSNMLAYIAENLYPRWRPVDIFVDRAGAWYVSGRPVLPADVVNRVDIVWNTAAPEYKQVLETLSIPVVGHSAFNALLHQNPGAFSDYAVKNNIKTPRRIVLPVYQPDFDGNVETYAGSSAKKVWQKFSPPWVVRAYSPDRNTAVRVAKTFPDLAAAIIELANRGDSILVEELITGKVATTHVVPGYRGEDLYHFPVNSNQPISKQERSLISDAARNLHNHLDSHYLKADFVIHPRSGVYLLGFDMTPDLVDGSLFSEACRDIGARESYVISHILESHLG